MPATASGFFPARTARLFERNDPVLREGRIGLYCNQTAWEPETGYLFQALAERGNLRRIFLPEHGLFAELQDQVPLGTADAARVYGFLGAGDTEFVSLYGHDENSLTVREEYLADLDALIVDIQDVGARYYTFLTTLSYIFDVLARRKFALTVYILDRPNPAGRQVEGIALPEAYASFVGRPGVPHRHGLTIGELARFFYHDAGCAFPLEIIPCRKKDFERNPGDPPACAWNIPPSPNMPGPRTPLLYSGQCLWEGTELSEGRGTTRPFEIFGAPYCDFVFREKGPAAPGAMLRPLAFLPAFHKHAGTTCFGFQILLDGRPYHSLAHSLRLLRFFRENSGDLFEWRKGPYEFRSDRPAIELLAGDPDLLDYLRGETSFERAAEAMAAGEEAWLRDARAFLLYPDALFRASLGD